MINSYNREIKISSQNLIYYCLKIIFLFCLLSFIFFDINVEKNILKGIIVIVLPLIMSYIARKNYLLFFAFLAMAYLNYSFCAVHYFNLMKISDTYSIPYDISTNLLNIMVIFTSFLFIVIPKDIKEFKIQAAMNNNINHLGVSIVFLISFILLIVFSFRNEGLNGRIDVNSYGEYSILFVIIGISFCSRNKYLKILYSIVSIAISLILFGFGGRITGLQLLLIIFFSCYSDKINKFLFFIISFLGLVIMNLIGIMRADTVLNLESFISSFNDLFSSSFALDTSYVAYHSSYVIYLVSLNDSFITKIGMFWKFILSMFLGGNAVSNSNLSSYAQKYQFHSGGGFLPVYFYYYLNYFGVVIISFILGVYIRVINKLKEFYENNSSIKSLILCISIYLSVSIFRWYIYSPSNLFRGVMILSLLWLGANIIVKVLKGKNNQLL